MARRRTFTLDDEPMGRAVPRDGAAGDDALLNPPSDRTAPGPGYVPPVSDPGVPKQDPDYGPWEPEPVPSTPGDPGVPIVDGVDPGTTWAKAPTFPIEGFNAEKMSNPEHVTPKYVFGRTAQQVGNDPAALLAALKADPSGYFKDATLEGDKLRIGGTPDPEFGGITEFDVFRGFKSPGGPQAAQWVPLGPLAAGGGGGAGGDGGDLGGIPGLDALGGGGNIEVGTDPLSQGINAGLLELITNRGRLGPSTEALNLENVRSAADRARRAEMEGVMSTLANRGLLPENAPGGMGGLALDALGRVERNDIAPLYSEAVRDYLLAEDEQANSNYLNALNMGTQRQNMLSQVALQSLAQNQAFNQFLAEFGLKRDQVLAELASGQDTVLMALLTAYLNAAKMSAGGHI